MKRKDYQRPTMKVDKLQLTGMLMTSGQTSGKLDDPDDYLDGGDPFNNSNARKKDLWDEEEFEE